LSAAVATQRKPFVGELLGRSDYAIIGEIVEPNTMVLDNLADDGVVAAPQQLDDEGLALSRHRRAQAAGSLATALSLRALARNTLPRAVCSTTSSKT